MKNELSANKTQDAFGVQDALGAQYTKQAKAKDILLLSGSPHERGNTETLSRQLEKELSLQGAHTTLWNLSEHPVAACYNCGNCLATGACVVSDAWHVLSKHMDNCDALVLIAPLYFAGPSAHLKAALDRCQSYWARKYRLKKEMPKNRPAYLIILGDGGDPFGSSALETICKSALNCASLRIDEHHTYRFLEGQMPAQNEIEKCIQDIVLELKQ